MYDIIASERSGVEVRVRVILRAVGNFVDNKCLKLRRTLRYGDIRKIGRSDDYVGQLACCSHFQISTCHSMEHLYARVLKPSYSDDCLLANNCSV